MREFPDELRDMTFEEIQASDEYDDVVVDGTDEQADVAEMMQILGAAIAIGKMFEDGHITFGEYMDLTEYLMEWDDDLDVSLL